MLVITQRDEGTHLIKNHTALYLLVIVLIAGCAREPLLLPDEGPTTADVFNQHSSSLDGELVHGRIDPATYSSYRPDIESYSRSAHNEIENLFPEVPNQILTGYVFPHLGSRGNPVPGYSTAFPVYEQTHFALPGEVPMLPYRDHRQ